MTSENSASSQVPKLSISATRIVASTVGVFAGLLGIEHGFFETLQGNVVTNGTVINAIGPQAGVGGSEPALTMIPNFFATGVIAIIVSIIVIIWAAAFLQRRHAGLILILLSIVQLLVGGGLVPIFLGIIAGLVATRINKPLTWWHAHLPVTPRRLLAHLWPWSLVGFFVLSLIDLEIAIFAANNENLINILPPFLFGLLFLTIVVGFAYDIERTRMTGDGSAEQQLINRGEKN